MFVHHVANASSPSQALLHSLKFETHTQSGVRDVLISLFDHVTMASGSWWYSEEIAQRFKELEDWPRTLCTPERKESFTDSIIGWHIVMSHICAQYDYSLQTIPFEPSLEGICSGLFTNRVHVSLLALWSFQLAVVMWLMTYVGAVFNGITILILGKLWYPWEALHYVEGWSFRSKSLLTFERSFL